MSVSCEILIVLVNIVLTNGIRVIRRGLQPERPGITRCASFNRIRCFFEGALVEINGINHLTAGMVWGHGIKNHLASPESANAGWATDLMAGKGKEIAAHFL